MSVGVRVGVLFSSVGPRFKSPVVSAVSRRRTVHPAFSDPHPYSWSGISDLIVGRTRCRDGVGGVSTSRVGTVTVSSSEFGGSARVLRR